MSRPVKCRRIGFVPDVLYFKPAGIPMRDLEEVELTLDELEAIRLADLKGLYQEDAAGHMNISRQTFANILVSAHNKIAEYLILGKALRIEGGIIEMKDRQFVCRECKHTWSLPFGSGRPQQCPQCQSPNIHRETAEERLVIGQGKGCRKRRRCCRRNAQEETA